jgi:hypothetical protein
MVVADLESWKQQHPSRTQHHNKANAATFSKYVLENTIPWATYTTCVVHMVAQTTSLSRCSTRTTSMKQLPLPIHAPAWQCSELCLARQESPWLPDRKMLHDNVAPAEVPSNFIVHFFGAALSAISSCGHD